MVERKIYFYKSSRISYLRFGSGLKPVICFHGYGETAISFTFLDKYAGDRFTFFSIDLPFHGETNWQEGLTFSPEELTLMIRGILSENYQVPFLSISSFSLMGFSLGGRAALSLLQQLPASVDRLILLAPDGLKVNFWYWLATQSRIGNKFFSFTMKKPAWFFGLLKLLNKLNLVNTSIFKFVKYYIGDAEVRRLLYTRWTALRKLKPDLPDIKEKIRQYNIPVRLVYGKHDRIILPSVGEKFKQGIEKQCSLSIIHSGHQVLHEKHVEEILPALLR
ncbi:MAG: alpha/beta hydrolase [Chitinophagaceae bacterium]|nr:alpha/beta hydrolase [Chitinophagaceae bacterium]